MTTDSIGHETGCEQNHSFMMAWRVHEFGPPETMAFESVPRPDPGPGEVLIKVHAAGVGPWDAWIRAGQSALPQPLPLTLARLWPIRRLGRARKSSIVEEPVRVLACCAGAGT
jgi:hypothetical protein